MATTFAKMTGSILSSVQMLEKGWDFAQMTGFILSSSQMEKEG